MACARIKLQPDIAKERATILGDVRQSAKPKHRQLETIALRIYAFMLNTHKHIIFTIRTVPHVLSDLDELWQCAHNQKRITVYGAECMLHVNMTPSLFMAHYEHGSMDYLHMTTCWR